MEDGFELAKAQYNVPVVKLKGPGELHAPARAGDAGMDLSAYLPEGPIILRVGETKLIPTGVHIELPQGHMALVLPRSGLALRRSISLMNAPGLIDQGYRGDVSAILVNHGAAPYIVSPGERIAQLVVLPVPLYLVERVEELGGSERGESGFGSTGTGPEVDRGD